MRYEEILEGNPLKKFGDWLAWDIFLMTNPHHSIYFTQVWGAIL